MKAYRYYTLYRPPLMGAVPKRPALVRGFDDEQLVPEIGRRAWGYVEYDRELTQEEIHAYELMPAMGKGVRTW